MNRFKLAKLYKFKRNSINSKSTENTKGGEGYNNMRVFLYFSKYWSNIGNTAAAF